MIRFDDGTVFEEASIYGGKQFLDGEMRRYLDITVMGTTYEAMDKAFVDGANFTVEQEGESFDKSEYCLAREITDYRNGKVKVRMCAKTETELAQEALEAENAALLYETITGEKWNG